MRDGGVAVEILTIGDELLLGQVVDGNAAWLGQRLAMEGIRVARQATVGDDAPAIREAVREGLDRTGVVICTGGLGPTVDDLTRPAAAEVFGRELRIDEAVVDHIRTFFARLGRDMPERNLIQAEVPEGATVFPNTRGTAPGLALEDPEGRLAILLPGVPKEMRGLIEEHVIPYLRRRWPERGHPILHRWVRTTGVPESVVADRVDDMIEALHPVSIAFLPGFSGVDIRLTSWGALEPQEAVWLFDRAEAELRRRLGHAIYGTDDVDLAAAVGAELARRGLTLALAESCTGGLLGKRLTDVPGASAYFVGGIVSYSNDAKEQLLGVRRETLVMHGAVSKETALEMAEGARRVIEADHALAVTGIAGPGGGTPEKPVGTVWVAMAGPDLSDARRLLLHGDREEIRERSAQAALSLLWKHLARDRP